MTPLCAWWPPPQDFWLAAFTFLLVIVGWLQWRTLQATHRSNRTIERAYVGLSHAPPGVQPIAGPSPSAWVSVRVKNHGRTPATVTDMSLTLLISSAPLPAEPPYAPGKPVAAFLTAGDEFFKSLSIIAGQFAQIQAGAPAYVLGYVDYGDQFGQRHRCGYARRFDASSPGNNLVFVTEAGYNYERSL